MTPRDLYHSLPLPEGEGGSWRGRTGLIPIGQLAGIVGHHTMREVSVHSESWGIAEMPKATVLRRLADDWFVRRCKRVEDEKGVKVTVSVTIYRVERVKHEAYRITLGTVGGRTDDDRIWIV